MRVVHLQRRRDPTQFSVEGYFSRVRQYLAKDTQVALAFTPFRSRGFWRRVANVVWAVFHQGDVIHVTGDVHYVTLLLRKRKTILTILDCEILERLSGWKMQVVKTLWYRLPARRVSAITVISQATAEKLLQHVRFPRDRIHVIPVSVSEGLSPSPKPFNTDRPTVLQLGTKHNKNIPRLVEALRALRCRLEIIGPIDASLHDLLRSSGLEHQTFCDLSEEEVRARYVSADVVSFVSTHEGFGMPIVEAQSVERVCVTSNCSSMPEVAGEGACFVDPFDISSIRSGFERVFRDEPYRQELIRLGRENRRRFDPRQIAKRFDSLYRAVVAGEPGRGSGEPGSNGRSAPGKSGPPDPP